jgi:5-methylcytosine-specific restriction protein B
MTIAEHVENLLRGLSSSKNVLLLGPPACGKSMLMAETAREFTGNRQTVAALQPEDAVPLPAVQVNNIPVWMPSPDRTDRRVFQITFHQGTKHRDFVSGIIPNLLQGESGFRVIHGLLMEANEHALAGGASLIMIDEMNRGPAVSIFGDTLTAIESDKRLDDNNSLLYTSAPFKVFNATTGEPTDVYLSPHVYLLASMNEADTSVEALDIAFLRRFKSQRLHPSVQAIQDFFEFEFDEIPEQATTSEHIVIALVNAWSKINEKISLGKGAAFQIGHGVILGKKKPVDLNEAKAWAVDCWLSIDALIKEMFYGNDQSLAIILNAKPANNYKFTELQFGDEMIDKLIEPEITIDNIYSILREIVN